VYLSTPFMNSVVNTTNKQKLIVKKPALSGLFVVIYFVT